MKKRKVPFPSTESKMHDTVIKAIAVHICFPTDSLNRNKAISAVAAISKFVIREMFAAVA
jgi:hypothetical protein